MTKQSSAGCRPSPSGQAETRAGSLPRTRRVRYDARRPGPTPHGAGLFFAGALANAAPTLMNAHLEEINRRRTFAIISHPDAGKTTLTEKLLLYGGAIQLAG